MSFWKRLLGSTESQTLGDTLGPVQSDRQGCEALPLTARPTAEVLRTVNWTNLTTAAAPRATASERSLPQESSVLATQPTRVALRGLNWANNRPQQTPTVANTSPPMSTGHPAHTVDDVMKQFAWD